MSLKSRLERCEKCQHFTFINNMIDDDLFFGRTLCLYCGHFLDSFVMVKNYTVEEFEIKNEKIKEKVS